MNSLNLNNLSIKELQNLVKKEYDEKTKLRKDKKKEKLIAVYQKLQNQNEKLRQEKPKIKSKPKNKPKTKSFDEYFQECINEPKNSKRYSSLS